MKYIRKWKIVDTELGAIPVPEIELRCKFCGCKLMLHQFIASYNKGHNFYHVDISLKCPNCDWFIPERKLAGSGKLEVFGVPISKEEYEKLRASKLHGKIIKELHELEIVAKLYNIPELHKKLVEERLKALGYW